MILINRAYSIVTEESAAFGEHAESGMLAENESVTFRELVDMLRYGESSCSPATGETFEWVAHDQGETQEFIERGEREERTIHYSRANPARNARYWRLAFIAAGLIKGANHANR